MTSPFFDDSAEHVPLAADEVHLWYVLSDDVRDPARLAWCQAVMNDEERARWRRFHFEKDRHQCLVTRGMIRGLLSRYAPVEPSRWTFSANNYGKPRIDRPSEFRQLSFNLSHTRGMVLCAIARNVELGIDVECLDRQVNLDLADRYFAQVEAQRLRSLAAAEQPRAFFDYWTLKEAFIKAHGAGLSLPLSDFWFRRGAEDPIEIEFSPNLADEDPQAWQFFTLMPSNTHQAAVAVRRAAYQHWQLSVRPADWLLKADRR